MSYQKNAIAVRLFSGLMKFSAWLQNIPNKTTPPPFRLLQIGSAFWQSRALYVAARLDIASVLGKDTLPVEALANRIQTQPDATYRLLRMLSAMGVFDELPTKRFRNNNLSHYLREDHPHSLRAMILMHNSDEMSRPWYEQLEHGIQTGEAPFSLTHRQALFEYLGSHPDFSSLFARAMDSVEALSGDSFATDFHWDRFDRIIDVGGSKGSKSLAILKRQPHLSALVMDAEEVISEARHYWDGKEDPALLQRLNFQSGDARVSVPAAETPRDIYFLSGVLHGYDDATCNTILDNLVTGLGNSGARILLMEFVLDETRPDFASTTFDMQMFMGTSGRERTLAEWKTLVENSGLVLEQRVNLRGFGKLLLLHRQGQA